MGLETGVGGGGSWRGGVSKPPHLNHSGKPSTRRQITITGLARAASKSPNNPRHDRESIARWHSARELATSYLRTLTKTLYLPNTQPPFLRLSFRPPTRPAANPGRPRWHPSPND